MRLLSVLLTFAFLTATKAVTIYSQVPLYYATAIIAPQNGTVSSNPPPGVYRAYDISTLNPPPLPVPLPATQWSINVPVSAASFPGLSIPIKGNFLGFSIEMSVAIQVIGLNSTHVNVPFLNLMSALALRGGSVQIRVGGNTQDYATYVNPSLPKGAVIGKLNGTVNNPTKTPSIVYTADMFYLMNNVSSLVGVKWYLGIPLNDSTNLRLQIAELGDQILGSNILGYQVGNEPDRYAVNQHRPATYGPLNYFNEFGIVVNAVNKDPLIKSKGKLIGPSIGGTWIPEQVWNTSFITAYSNSLGALSVQHYPSNNCFAIYGTGALPVNYQAKFATYMAHSSAQKSISTYLNSTIVAQQAGKPLMMSETNTASCGGFPGISNSFGAALWGLDYGLLMAASNFSGALFHVSGRNVFYNPFTPPPTNETAFRAWTIGPLFYSALVSAEIFGTSGTAQIIDLNANTANTYTPAYAIYENGKASKFALFNFMDDPSGANAYTATISVSGTVVPPSVQVKYLTSPSVATIGNITWAGQSYGSVYASDGRLNGTESIQTVACNQGANICQIKVPAPGFALVFFNAGANGESYNAHTYSTTAFTNTKNTVTVNPSVLSTSNGSSGKDRGVIGCTSSGSCARNGAGSVKLGRDAFASVVSIAVVGLGLFFVRLW